MVSERLEESSILELWSHVVEILNSIEELDKVTGERDLRRRIEERLGWGRQGEVGVLGPKAWGECVRLLLVPCSLDTFYKRLFEVKDIAEHCNKRSGIRLEGVMFLPVSWSQEHEARLATDVASMFREYGVVQTCVKFPLSAFPRCWR
jgi:hypothetical protein